MRLNIDTKVTCLITLLVSSLALVDIHALQEDDDQPQGTETVPATTQAPPSSTTSSTSSSTTTAATASSTTSTTTTTTSTTAAPKARKCSPPCECRGNKITCNGLTSPEVLKAALRANLDITEVYLKNVPYNQFILVAHLTPTVEVLDLSNNNIKTIFGSQPGVKKQLKEADGLKLKKLILANNKLENLSGHFNTIRLPSLTLLNLSSNPLTELKADHFKNVTNLNTLNLDNLRQLETIHEASLYPLVQLNTLTLRNLSSIKDDLGDDFFAKNINLRSLDLSFNQLIEVPTSVRQLGQLEELDLSGNLMTSLRPSDFRNLNYLKSLKLKQCVQLTKVDEFTFGQMENLKSLIISNNPTFSYFSSDAFKSRSSTGIKSLNLLDLSYNNLSVLVNPNKWPSVKVATLSLEGNPWDCQCSLDWLLELRFKSELHCNTPDRYKDINVQVYFKTTDCELEESSLQKCILVLFLLFLAALAVGVFVQKSDICRRLQWRDQYGTIYYTKASFPPSEQT